MALVAVMSVLMVLLAVILIGYSAGGGGAMGRSDSVLRSGRRRAYVYAAQSLAETGMRLTMHWLNDAPIASPPTTAFAPSSTGRAFFGATVDSSYNVLTLAQGVTGDTVNGTIRVRLYPYSTNAVNNRRSYIIESVGVYQGASQILRCVVAEKTFARYAFFSDSAPTSYFVAGSSAFNGPVHINAMNAAGTGVDSAAAINILWKDQGTTSQIFRYNGVGNFTTSAAASQIKWQQNSAGNYVTPSTSQWSSVTATGTAPTTGVPVVKMPASSSSQATAALGTSGTAPSTTGVLVPNNGSTTTGGIYIQGDVSTMKLSTGGTGNVNQIIEVIQVSGTTETKTTITINPTTNSTTTLTASRAVGASTWGTGVSTSFNGTPNGVVYVNGNIGDPTANTGGLSGTVANNVMSGSTVTKSNSMSIVTDAASAININGGIVYQNLISDSSNANNIKSTSASANTTSGTLGIVSKQVKIVDNDAGGTPLTDISVHATVMAFDTFNVTNPETRSVGAFKLIGGYIVKTNGKFGQADAATGNIISGFAVTRSYDFRAADNPPPYFPNEENGFQLTAFQRVGSTIQ
jgi:hypothetical protein